MLCPGHLTSACGGRARGARALCDWLMAVQVGQVLDGWRVNRLARR